MERNSVPKLNLKPGDLVRLCSDSSFFLYPGISRIGFMVKNGINSCFVHYFCSKNNKTFVVLTEDLKFIC